MSDDVAVLQRRLDRERRARLEAERIAEETSRSLFVKSQELERTLAGESRARSELNLFHRALEEFTRSLDAKEIVARLRGFLEGLLSCDEVRVEVVEGLTAGEVDPASLRVPLGPTGEERGALVISTGQELPPDRLFLVRGLAREAALALGNAALYREVQRLSVTDPMTGLANRRGFEPDARRLLALAKRHGRPLAGMMIDIDHFKQVNDTRGHAGGDTVLCAVAKACDKSIRSTDLFARLGGEEFFVLCPETPGDTAVILAERLRQQVVSLRPLPMDPDFHVTISLGVAVLSGADDTLEEVLRRSDEALYQAKSGGRNRVAIVA